MTHFATVVLVDKSDNLEEEVTRLLAPYDEEGEWGADGSRWDWWQIGGRFTGTLDGYEYWKDQRNYEHCRWCEGTGTTPQSVADQYPVYQDNVGKPCRQCNRDPEETPFPGSILKFGLEPHRGDILPVSEIDFDRMRFVPSSIVTPDGEWHERARYGMFAVQLPNEQGEEPKDEEVWAREFSQLVNQHRNCLAVLVDCHV